MSTYDNVYIAISFFAFALFLLVALVFWNGLNSDEMDETFWEQTPEGISARDSANVVYENLDTTATIVYFALHLGILVMAFALRSHPFVYVAGIFIIIITIVLAAPLSNTYEEVINSNDDLITASADLPKVGFIMGLFPVLEMVWGFITAVIMYGLARGEGLV